MTNRLFKLSVLAGGLSLSLGLASAADPNGSQAQAGVQTQNQEQVYGSQLMTRQERVEFRTKMRAAKTVQEREQIRKEHHERMKERAKARGVTLPDEPPAMGGGMGPGGGMGGGMGPGGGMGGGRR